MTLRNEKGDPFEFIATHPFLIDIYDDNSQELVVMKAAQVGMSTCQILKNHRDAKRYKMDIIYTLPTDQDVRVFVGGKVNRIIANNPEMLKDVADKDSIEQKAVGGSMIYFRGTWTKKAAIMVTGDRLVHDEKDSSKLDVVADYQARLQHSKFKQIHTFSHPSLPETGVHADWLESDQKHWFITCPHCGLEQFMNWDTENPRKMSVDIEKRIYVCKKCRGEIDDYTRADGHWIAKNPEKQRSGYWVPLLICPWVSAGDIIDKFKNKDTTAEFFYTKILGLPYADATAKLLRDAFFQNLTGTPYAPTEDERVVIGIDTGLRLDYVIGNSKGIFFHGDTSDYVELERLMDRWPKAMAFIDQGGDLIGSRKFYEKYPGRVFLCALTGDRKGKELVKWGKGDEQGTALVDRNRMIQFVIDEFRNKRIPVHGTEEDWFEYWLDWNNIAKIKVLDPDTNETKGYKWVRSGRDHRAMATVFWRVGMRRFGGMGALIPAQREETRPNSYVISPQKTVNFDPLKMFGSQKQQEDLEIKGGKLVNEPKIAKPKLDEESEAALDRLEEEKIDW
jgi:DNA-directed RNA polymerase subunit RPC12/RpoP